MPAFEALDSAGVNSNWGRKLALERGMLSPWAHPEGKSPWGVGRGVIC